eukprot:jgi/Chrzof1/280/Cz01g09230.t1
MRRKVTMHLQLRGTPSQWHPWTLSARARTADLEHSNLAIVAPRKTGLPMVVYISSKYAVYGPRWPRISVSKRYADRHPASNPRVSNQWCFMTIADEPVVIAPSTTGSIELQDLEAVEQFILINKQVLLDYWHQKHSISTEDMLAQLQPIQSGDFSTHTPSHDRE